MFISEFLPNPIGKDTEGEWIKIFNNEDRNVNLYNWKIKDASGKTFIFKNIEIKAGEYLILDYKTTKISLNNNGETIFLYDSRDILVDKAEFVGVANEGKTLIRQNNNQFVFSGQQKAEEKNIVAPKAQFISNVQSINVVNTANFTLINLLICFSCALILSFIFIFTLRKLESLFRNDN